MFMEQLSSKLLLLRSYGSKKVPYKLGYKLSAPFLNYDWLMVALTTIDQLQLTLGHPKIPEITAPIACIDSS